VAWIKLIKLELQLFYLLFVLLDLRIGWSDLSLSLSIFFIFFILKKKLKEKKGRVGA
jgi:hypothetical protein